MLTRVSNRPLAPLFFRAPRELGTSAWTFSYDFLHVVFLGIALSYISKAISVLLLSDVFGVGRVRKPILIFRISEFEKDQG